MSDATESDGSIPRWHPVAIGRALSAAWADHRMYVYFSAALFGLGFVAGIALFLAGVDLLEFVMELFEEEIVPTDSEGEGDITARFFIVHNTVPFLASILGAITLGLLTAWIMVFNGIILGNIGFSLGQLAGFDFVLIGILPHGIFELPALFIAAGVGFRLVHRFYRRIRGRLDAVWTRTYVYRSTLLVAFAWVLLAVAAVIEAHLTPVLLETLFAERLEDL